MGIDQTDRDWDAGQEEYARDFMEETNESLEQIRTPDGLFSMSCYGHCLCVDPRSRAIRAFSVDDKPSSSQQFPQREERAPEENRPGTQPLHPLTTQ